MDKLESLCTLGGKVKYIAAVKNSMVFLKKLKIELPYDPAILLLSIYQRTENTRDICASMFIAVLVTIAKMWKLPKYPSMDKRISKIWYVHTVEYYSALKKKEFCHMLQHG